MSVEQNLFLVAHENFGALQKYIWEVSTQWKLRSPIARIARIAGIYWRTVTAASFRNMLMIR
jgi:hypothetical protein